MYNKLTEKDGNILVDGENINETLAKYNNDDFIAWKYYGLVSSLCNENTSELRYIKELVRKKIDCNFPLLICDCDLDFSCTVAVVKVKFCENCVKWEKIGNMAGRDRKAFFEEYRNSGIRRVEDWSDDDWQKYGGIAYDLLHDDYFFNDWCAKNWKEELYRRCWGYYHKYFNNDNNINWLKELDYKFQLSDYQKFFAEN